MKKSLLTLTILVVSFCFTGLVYAEGFTMESIQGNYACQGSAGPKFAGIGVMTADASGNISGSLILRIWKQRFEVSMEEGTYTVNDNGTGRMTFKIADDAGESAELSADFIIMQAEIVDDVKLATELFSVQDEIFGTPPIISCKRLP